MRIDENTKKSIIEYAKYYFNDFHLYLFGSRVDDSKKGGDIDLFIESSSEIDLQTQMLFLKELYKNTTQRKIDLVVKTPLKSDRPIFKTAKQTGILLC